MAVPATRSNTASVGVHLVVCLDLSGSLVLGLQEDVGREGDEED